MGSWATSAAVIDCSRPPPAGLGLAAGLSLGEGLGLGGGLGGPFAQGLRRRALGREVLCFNSRRESHTFFELALQAQAAKKI